MASIRISYQKLKKIPTRLEAEVEEEEEEKVVVRRRNWLRLRLRRRWKRPTVRIAGLRRLLRRKTSVVGAAVRKVVKRLKEGRPYFEELFAGNYMFMQVSPSPTTLGYLEKSFFAAHHHALIPPPSSRVNLFSAVSLANL